MIGCRARNLSGIAGRWQRERFGFLHGCKSLTGEANQLGIRRAVGEMILGKGQGAIEIEKSIIWLRDENAKGAHIHVRATGLYGRGKLNVVLYSAN